MNDYFKAKMAKRELDAERHARFLAADLTEYPFETVLTAAAELWDAHDQYLEAYAAYSDAIVAAVPAEDRRYPAWWRYAGQHVQDLVAAHDRVFKDAPSLGGVVINERISRHSTERYPLSKWKTRAGKYRAAAKRLRKAIDAFRAGARAQ